MSKLPPLLVMLVMEILEGRNLLAINIKIIFYFVFVTLLMKLVVMNELMVDFQVLGNAKGAVAVVVSILIFRNPVSVTGMAGYTLTVIGVILYSEAKKRSSK